MYYTTLETYKKKYQHRSLTHAYSAKTKEEHEVWKKSLRDRLWEITGMNKCVYCEPDAQYLRTDRINDLIAEYWVIKFLGENPGASPWDEAKKYFSKSLMSISSEYTL